MAGESKEGPSIPVSGIIGVVLVAATIVAQQVKLDSARLPPEEPRRPMERPWVQKVDARLWQDPMAAVARYREQKRAAKHQSEQLARQLGVKAPGGNPELLPPDDDNEIGRVLRTPTDETVCLEHQAVRIMGAMVLGGATEEDAEMRRRTRYAVASGLLNAGYVPDNADTIGYAYVPPSIADGYYAKAPATIPFEWFKRTADSAKAGHLKSGQTEWMLVLWLDQSYYYAEPVRRLRHLLAYISPSCGQLEAHILGPVDSGSLNEFIADIRREREWDMPVGTIPLDIVSASATAELENTASQYVYRSSVTRLWRVVGSDKRMTGVLVDEIRTRKPATPHPLLIVISEHDTNYGRQFVEHIDASNKEARPADRFELRSYSYLRQIDGGRLAPPAQRPASPDAEAEKRRESTITRSHGSHHIDYLQRLVDTVKAEGEASKKEVAAIGIFGNDVYDKLLVLRALRPAFPKALFLTTDLDARLLDVDESKWTSNLIVATNYALALSPDIHRGAAPFRDGYQTGTYLAALLIAGNCAGQTISTLGDQVPWLEAPLLFEIGRTSAVALNDRPPQGRWPLSQCTFQNGEQPTMVQPALSKPGPPLGTMATYAALALGIALLARPLFRWADSGRHAPAPRPRHGLRGVAAYRRTAAAVRKHWPAGAIAALGAGVGALVDWGVTSILGIPAAMWIGLSFAAALCYGVLHARQAYEEHRSPGLLPAALIGPGLYAFIATAIPVVTVNAEPFAWIEGVSVWPTQLIRWLAAALAVFSIWHIRALAKKSVDEINREFGFASRPASWPHGAGISHWWARYREHRHRRITATIVFAFAYLAMSSILMFTVGTLPGTPVRGAANLHAVQLLLGFVVFLSVVLLVAVAFACRGFVKDILEQAMEGPLAFPNARAYEAAHNLPNTDNPAHRGYTDLVLAVDLVAQRSRTLTYLIYFPFAVCAMMLVARSSLFDAWDTPPGLAIVLLLPFAIVIACVVWLRFKTVEFRQRVLRDMDRELLRLRGATFVSDAHMWQLERLRDRVHNETRGSFQSLALQPFIRALLLPIGGFSGIEILEHVLLR